MKVDVKLDNGPILAYETGGLNVMVGDRIEVPGRPHFACVEQGEVWSLCARYSGECKVIRSILKMVPREVLVPAPPKRRWPNITVAEAFYILSNELGRDPTADEITNSGLGRYLIIRRKDFLALTPKAALETPEAPPTA